MIWFAVGLILGFLAVLVTRAALFRPKEETPPEPCMPEFDRELAVEHLRGMIRCKTVSREDPADEDDAEFARFRQLIREYYPTVFERGEVEQVPPRTLLIRIRGRESGDPTVLMAHYDVVPAEEENWKQPPFEAKIVDGELWGRGSLDTKITDLGILESTENLLKQGFVPKVDLYIALGGDEETHGLGARNSVELFRQRGITPGFVLDEGGAVVDNVFPGVKERCALIGTAEKGFMNACFTIESDGGHASTPPAKSNIGRLADAVRRVEAKPFPARLSAPIAEMFDTLGRRSTFLYRLIFANIRIFLPLLSALYKRKGGELNAMLRTTVAFTMMEGSAAHNVMPPKASMLANLRLMNGDSVGSAVAQLQELAGDSSITVSPAGTCNDPSPESRTDCEQWRQLRTAVAQTWPDAVISPYLMLQCSDAYYYSQISPYVYRFCAMALSAEQRGTIHGRNERISVDAVAETVGFYMNLLRQR